MEERGTKKVRKGGGREFYEIICTWEQEATQHNRVITLNWRKHTLGATFYFLCLFFYVVLLDQDIRYKESTLCFLYISIHPTPRFVNILLSVSGHH